MSRKDPEWTPEWFGQSIETAYANGWQILTVFEIETIQVYTFQRRERQVTFQIVDMPQCKQIQMHLGRKCPLMFFPTGEYYNSNGFKLNKETFVGRIETLLY